MEHLGGPSTFTSTEGHEIIWYEKILEELLGK